MRLLLDTHCWLWAQGSWNLLGEAVHAPLMDESHELLLSAASAWEIAIKTSLGKLKLPMPPGTYLEARMSSNDVHGLPISFAHAVRAGALPRHHRDPFDRMLVAQAQIEDLTLVTADPQILAYEVAVLWAGTEPMPPRPTPRT